MLFRELSASEQVAFRQWARKYFKPGDSILDGLWHPVTCDECRKIEAEAEAAAELKANGL